MNSISRKKFLALFGCSLILTIAYMSLSSWGLAVPFLSETFQLNTIMIQLGNAALIAGYAVGSFVEGRLLKSWGWKKTFLFAMALFLAGSVSIPFVTSYPLIVFLRFIMGFGLIVNVTTFLVSGWFSLSSRGLAVGVLLGCIGLGTALGGFVTGALSALFSWQNIFLILAALTLIGVIAFLLLVKDPPRQNTSTATVSGQSFQGSIYKQPALWLFALSLLFVFFNVYGLYAYLASYMQTLGYSVAEIGLIVLFNGLIAVASTPFGGLLSDWLVKKTGNVVRARAYAIAFSGAAVGVVGCLLIPLLAPLNIGFAILTAIISGWGCPAANSPILSLPSDIFGSEAAGAANGMVILIAGIGGILSPILVPAIAQATSWTVGWVVTAAAAFVCMVLSLLLPRVRIKN
ncbi:MAG: MFS transporter [Christensenella sp.]|uniref:MFS transporter n=1 Tax=Christensenella sp. TaxID=1935934 RepID=UPI002B21241E|nr:MFS transporter [Christensenella sp.]MEA5002101.1 MFS transporter [Christensenella sp.]